MGNQLLTRQKSDIEQSQLNAKKADDKYNNAVKESTSALSNVHKIAADIIEKAGEDPDAQRTALTKSPLLAQAQQIVQMKQRMQHDMEIQAKQARATASAIARLENRKTTENIYGCPEFKPCTGPGAYNQTRANGMVMDYNRTFARRNKDMFIKAEDIYDGGENACVVGGTFYDRVNNQREDKKKKFQYDCDSRTGWKLSSTEDVESMVGGMAY
jgi:hypothetical protein